MDWDREKIKQVLQELSKLPDFHLLPIPDSWGKEYDIPITPQKIIDLKTYLGMHEKSRNFTEITSYETRGPAPGGVREIEMKPVEVYETTTFKIIKDESGTEILEPLSESSALSTESNMKEQPVSLAESSTNVSLASHDVEHTNASCLHSA